MVFGFFHVAGPASQSDGTDSHKLHSRNHIPRVVPPAATKAVLAGTAPEVITNSTAATSAQHPVLDNGHGIKHLASHRGYAKATDGVRLYYEIFESRRQAADGSFGACYEVNANAGPSAAAASGAMPASGITQRSERSSGSPEARLATPPKSCGDGIAEVSSPGAREPNARFRVGGAGPEATTPFATGCKPTLGSPPAAPAVLPVGDKLDAEQRRQPQSQGNAATELERARVPAAVQAPVEGGPYPEQRGAEDTTADAMEDVANVVLIMGFAAGRHGWLPLINHWMQQSDSEPLHHQQARFCVFDNRGIGDSDSPPHSRSYSTAIMAQDTLAIMNHLGWQRAHVVGFSMGGMVALRLAVAAPERLLSLTALSVTNGGWQVIPMRWRSIKLLLWAATARSPHQRAHADVHFHFSRDTLHAEIPMRNGGPATRGLAEGDAVAGVTANQAQRIEAALIEEYVTTSLECAPQPHEGLMGQLHAVWTHGLTTAEQHKLRHLAVPFKVIHGYHDVMAMPAYGERIAKHAHAAFIMLNGGHFIARECAPEVSMHIADSIASAKKLK